MRATASLLLTLVTACTQHSEAPPPQTTRATPTDPAAVKQPAPAHAAAQAAAPAPPLQCDTGTGDCDGLRDNGCEVRLADDRAHCGGCDQACPEGGGCLQGRCRLGIVSLAAGGSHTCGLAASGALFCWGLNGAGQLGLPQARVRRVATPTELNGVRQVVAGRYHTCALGDDGRVSCFGERGQHGAVLERPPKTGDVSVVTGLQGVTHLATASNHSCAVHEGGHVSCWGANTRGQLGDATTERSQTPVPVPLPTDAGEVTSVAAGNGHSCALGRDGHVHCWGMNRYGQLGDGSTEDRPAAVRVEGLDDVVQIDAGEFHTCARTRTGKLLCWGRNEAGQLGSGDRDDHARPQPVLDDVAQLSVGERHTCALRSDGSVLCWGDNNDGRLGDGTRRDRRKPTPVEKLPAARHIAAGSMHSCAATLDGRVLCWGANDGQIGDGTLTLRRRPAAVTGRRFVELAAAGKREPKPAASREPTRDAGIPRDAATPTP